jgi:hypothetical protein
MRISQRSLALVMFVFGCSSSGASGTDGGNDFSGVCQSHHSGTTADGDAVEICDQLFSPRPFVRLPPDQVSTSGSSVLFAALDLFGNLSSLAAVDRNGTLYAMVDDAGNLITSLGIDPPPSLSPSRLRMVSNRNLFLIYRLTGNISTYKDPSSGQSWPSLHITDGAPVVLLEGKAIDSVLIGALEGTISKLASPGKWDPNSRVPIRLSLTGTSPQPNLHVWSTAISAPTLPDGQVFAMNGTVDNFSQSVRASDGSCMGALFALGANNPFPGASVPTVSLYRLAGMHGPGDQVMVLVYPPGVSDLGPNGMVGLRVLAPGGLIQVSPSGEWSSMSIFPHGTPNGNRIDLHPVMGGGGGC